MSIAPVAGGKREDIAPVFFLYYANHACAFSAGAWLQHSKVVLWLGHGSGGILKCYYGWSMAPALQSGIVAGAWLRGTPKCGWG